MPNEKKESNGLLYYLAGLIKFLIAVLGISGITLYIAWDNLRFVRPVRAIKLGIFGKKIEKKYFVIIFDSNGQVRQRYEFPLKITNLQTTFLNQEICVKHGEKGDPDYILLNGVINRASKKDYTCRDEDDQGVYPGFDKSAEHSNGCIITIKEKRISYYIRKDGGKKVLVSKKIPRLFVKCGKKKQFVKFFSKAVLSFPESTRIVCTKEGLCYVKGWKYYRNPKNEKAEDVNLIVSVKKNVHAMLIKKRSKVSKNARIIFMGDQSFVFLEKNDGKAKFMLRRFFRWSAKDIKLGKKMKSAYMIGANLFLTFSKKRVDFYTSQEVYFKHLNRFEVKMHGEVRSHIIDAKIFGDNRNPLVAVAIMRVIIN